MAKFEVGPIFPHEDGTIEGCACCFYEPYDVECARCGITLSCENAYVEEGDEWECEGCNIRCDAREYFQCRGLDVDLTPLADESVEQRVPF